ncbi:MAG: alpha/beta hydrolase [Chryseolinea sp.]
MKRISIVLFLIALTISSCNSSQSEKGNTTTIESAKVKQDSISGYVSVNGLNMYYEIYGEGKPLVLLHGGGSTINTSFGRIIPELSKHRIVIGIELQAHGHTNDRDSDISFEQDADDVAALLKKLEIPKADFFGFSNGGNTTMQIAIRHPELVDKIIVSSSFYKRSGVYSEFWEFMNHAAIENMPQLYKDTYAKVAPHPENLQSMHDKCVKRMVTFKDWSDDQIKSIKAPTLLIIGDADMVRPEHAVEMYRLIPSCQLAILPGGHGKYMGEITTLSKDNTDTIFCVPMIEEFLNAKRQEN